MKVGANVKNLNGNVRVFTTRTCVSTNLVIYSATPSAGLQEKPSTTLSGGWRAIITVSKRQEHGYQPEDPIEENTPGLSIIDNHETDERQQGLNHCLPPSDRPSNSQSLSDALQDLLNDFKPQLPSSKQLPSHNAPRHTNSHSVMSDALRALLGSDNCCNRDAATEVGEVTQPMNDSRKGCNNTNQILGTALLQSSSAQLASVAIFQGLCVPYTTSVTAAVSMPSTSGVLDKTIGPVSGRCSAAASASGTRGLTTSLPPAKGANGIMQHAQSKEMYTSSQLGLSQTHAHNNSLEFKRGVLAKEVGRLQSCVLNQTYTEGGETSKRRHIDSSNATALAGDKLHDQRYGQHSDQRLKALSAGVKKYGASLRGQPFSPIEEESTPEPLVSAEEELEDRGIRKRRQKMTVEEKEDKQREKDFKKNEKKRRREEDRILKALELEQSKHAKNAQKDVSRALKGTDGEKRIRVKFSAAAASRPWYGPTMKAIQTWYDQVNASGSKAAASMGTSAVCVCEVPINPPLPLSHMACLRWTRSMPRDAAELLEGSHGGAQSRPGGAHTKDDAVQVYVPLLMVILSPEEFVDQIQADSFRGLIGEAAQHHPECTLQLVTFGLHNYLARKQTKCPGFNSNSVTDLMMDLTVNPQTAAIHMRTDLKDEAQLACFITEETRVIARDLQRRRQEGYLTTFCRKGEGLELVLPKDKHDESIRTFARALMQNCLLDKEKAATVATKWGSLGSLLNAYADKSMSDKQFKKLLMGSNDSGGRSLGLSSSTAVYSLLSRRDPLEWVERGEVAIDKKKKE
ncbi:hypothetical protein CEUSTIGMA_g7205.t1 [Chlamydomonas eustigma]|uniref:ERCC4 domain-containing protein n=1 Tax=Chlamydomonas eustigma TaxID=1157962 RepID=A0A250X9L3_9CHLO|nr:hypothetical protein CEUSTIGMA_g7205.t1 [Chlamydomonas eustigma]|eukprot:GAX79764.1 hypothetical protein CEUSTIGMA_g7205.t1 [Chlamydomonas eustigma]